MKEIKIIIILGIILLVLDSIYITITKNIFSKMIQNIQHEKMVINLYGAIACYMLLIFGLYYFIIKNKCSLLDAFLFGFIIYGVFDSTSYALFSKWSLKIALMDAIWGGVLMTTTTYLTYKILEFNI